MDVKMMHEMIEKLTECAKYELDKGVEAVDTKEMGEVTDIIKDLAEAMYYRTLTEAMKDSEYGEDYDEYGPMDDGRRGYRGQPRDSMGRFRSRRGRGGRRGYEEPIYHMTPDMYRQMPIDWERDMDREGMGRMYYSGSGSSGQSSGGSSGGNMGGSSMGSSGGGSRGYSDGNYGGNDDNRGGRDSREGRSGNARRGYIETKEMGKDKQEKMKELENYMKTMAEDLTEAIEGASPEERSMAKQKLSLLVSKM